MEEASRAMRPAEQHNVTLTHFVGHATLGIEMDGVRLLADPVLREGGAPAAKAGHA